MKKIITILTCLVLTLAMLCGCGKKDTSSTSTESTTKVDGITLTAYKNITADWESTSNSQLLVNALAEMQITSRAVKEGDTANIDYTGYKNGIKFEGGEAKGYDLTIGSGSFIEGFEDGLIGVMPGETKNLNLTFPENYSSADLAGQAVVFKVKVNYITTSTPNIDDYTDEQKLTAKQSVFQSALVNHVVENSEADKLPQTQVATYTEKFRELYTQQASQYGYASLDAFIEASGQTKEDFENLLKESAEAQVKSELVIKAIADLEDIKVEESEYKDSIKNYASTYSTTEEEFVSANGEDFIRSVILQQKVADFLSENSVCK